MWQQAYKCNSRDSDQVCPKTRLHLRNLLIQARAGLVGRLALSEAASEGVDP